MELAIINKLFLELSQIATAKTARQLAAEKLLFAALSIANNGGDQAKWDAWAQDLAVHVGHPIPVPKPSPRTPAIMNPAKIVPTHKCRVCGALWRVNLERDTAEPESWQLCSTKCSPCCDNAIMGEQIIPAAADEVLDYLSNVKGDS